MARYLLTCSCGKSVPVDAGQAGGQVVCSCGATLDVPTLRKLRHLPSESSDQAKPSVTWTARKGATAIFLILAGLLTALALVNRLTEPKLPEFQPLVQFELVNQELQDMTPVEAWKSWIALYRPLAEHGFTIMQSQFEPAIRAQIARQRFMQTAMLIVAGICALLAIIIAVWTRSAPRGS